MDRPRTRLLPLSQFELSVSGQDAIAWLTLTGLEEAKEILNREVSGMNGAGSNRSFLRRNTFRCSPFPVLEIFANET